MTTHENRSPRTDSPRSRRATAALTALLSLGWSGACAQHERRPQADNGVDAGSAAPAALDGSTSPVVPRAPTAQPTPVPTAPVAPTVVAAPSGSDAGAPGVPPLRPPGADAGLPDAGTATTAPTAPAAPVVPVAEARAEIVGHLATGTLCPSDSTSWSLEPGAEHFSVQLGGELDASGSEAAAPLSGACTLTLDLELPAGLRIGNPDIALMPVAIGAVELTTHYTFVAGDSIAEHTRTLTDDRSLSERGDAFWSAPCTDGRTKQRAQLVIELRATVPVGSYLGAFTLSSSFSYEGGAEFRTCAGEALVPAAAGPDGRCSSHPKYPCAADLTCDVLDDRTDVSRVLHEGTCVDPKSTRAAQPLDAACGGARNVACEPGLVCHYGSPERAALRPVGICAKVSPATGERCGGSPLLVCATGLYCGTLSRASDAKYCQEGGGTQGARCAEGLATCGPGLVCNGEVCTPKLAARGERCGEGVAACGHLDACSERTGRCVANAAAGSEGTRCIADAECDRGLSCLQAKCSVRSTGEPGSACQVPNDCTTGLTCRTNVCSE